MVTVQEQIEFEKEMHTEWQSAWVSNTNKNIDAGLVKSVPLLHRLMLNALPEVVEALHATVNDRSRGQGGKYRAYIKEVTPEVAANLAISLSVADASVEENLTKVLRNLGTAVIVELNYRRANAVNPIYMREVRKSLEESRSKDVTYINRTVRAATVACSIDPLMLDAHTVISIGKLMLQPVYDLGIFETVRNYRRGRQVSSTLKIHDSLLEEAVVIPAYQEARCTPPLLVPPAEIGEYGKGGMWQTMALYQQYRLVRAPRKSAKLYDSLHHDLKTVRECVTELANVPLRVNVSALNLISNNIVGGGFKLPSEPKLPELPYDIPEGMTVEMYASAFDENKQQRIKEDIQDYRIARATYEAANRKYKVSTTNLYSNLQLARKLLKTNRFHLVPFADSRGRIYYTGGFNPQGIDAQRALLEFADGVELGEHGLYWLKVHIANCFGFDKKHFDTRVEFVDAMLDRIKEATPLPTVHQEFWEEADMPFSAWTACLELVQALNMPDPTKYLSRTITAWDATCSGIQHFSAMLRDPIGAAATNLIGGGAEKADIYMQLATAVQRKVQFDYDARDPDTILLAQFWTQLGVCRDLAKPPIMTYVYGLTQYACTDGVAKWMYENKVETPEGVSRFLLAKYLSDIMYNTIPDIVPAAAACMEWLQTLAKVVARDREYVHCIAPTGFHLYNLYQKEKAGHVRINAFDIQALRIYTPMDTPDVTKCGNGFAPNFVHLLDASHLTLAVLEAAKHGMQSVTTHDSFGCHAGNAHKYIPLLRNTFADMYRDHDPIQQLADRYGIAAPPKGTFNIDDVRDAVYPFS